MESDLGFLSDTKHNRVEWLSAWSWGGKSAKRLEIWPCLFRPQKTTSLIWDISWCRLDTSSSEWYRVLAFHTYGHTLLANVMSLRCDQADGKVQIHVLTWHPWPFGQAVVRTGGYNVTVTQTSAINLEGQVIWCLCILVYIKLSPYQAVEAYGVVRCWGSHLSRQSAQRWR
jgi:hypothetical protein